MASAVQDGCRNSNEHNFDIFQYYGVISFALSLYFCQQHKSRAFFVKLVKNGGSIQNGGSKSEYIYRIYQPESFQHFFNLLFARIWC
jgi:hypothetical protein